MVEKTFEQLKALQSKIYGDLVPLQARQGHIHAQIISLIDPIKMSHRNYAKSEAWRTDKELSPKVRAKIAKLLLQRDALGRQIKVKFAQRDALFDAAIVAYKKQQRKPKIKRRIK